MRSVAAARAKSEEMASWAQQVGEILSRKPFGERGPELHTSLAGMEHAPGAAVGQVAAGLLQKSVTDQGERFPNEAPWPTRGVGCAVPTQDQPRWMTAAHGDVTWQEMVSHGVPHWSLRAGR